VQAADGLAVAPVTEYTPLQRGGTAAAPKTGTQSPQVSVTPAPAAAAAPSTSASPAAPAAATPAPAADAGPDPATLPVATAPASHPALDVRAVGTLDGRPVLDVDVGALADKGWRRPGADLADWFNYGFDELSWAAYAHRRRELGEQAALLKAGVVVRPFWAGGRRGG
jgi:pre-mRNA 3'-end-processing factor FIP1